MGYSHENLLYACSAFHYYLGSLRYLQQYREAARNESDQNHFSVLFSKRTGYAPLTYFNQLKIQQACQLLDFTDMKVNQICYKIGIEDTYYFSRLFSKVMGMSPREYKKQKKG